MTKEEAFVGLRVKYNLKQQYRNRDGVGRDRVTSIYGVIVKLGLKEAIIRHAPHAEIWRPYDKLEAAL